MIQKFFNYLATIILLNEKTPICEERKTSAARPAHLCRAAVNDGKTFARRARFFRPQESLCHVCQQPSHDGHLAVWLPAPIGVQEMLVAASPKKFFKPAYGLGESARDTLGLKYTSEFLRRRD